MRQIANTEGLNITLNQIVDYELDKTLDEMIATVKDWKKSSDVVSCDTVIELLKKNKSRKD